MHSMGIMLPKWGNNTKELYEVKESATFLIFVSRQENKVYMAKVLKKNKYCATLIGVNTAKNYRFEPAILQAQKTIFIENHFQLYGK